ncbi:MAG TPA: zinc metallopeptidase [Anaerolineales bacterium]|nr:zinc metallopeptidase [Anaerolineales bacterium]
MFFLDPTYLCFMAPAFLLMMITTFYVRSSFNKWSKVPARSGLTGYDAAQRLIARAGLYGLQIESVRGNLTDNYDPRTKVLHLSQGVSGNASVASLAVAAHEIGHAQQDSEGYFPLRFRSALVPMVNIGSYLGWILIIAGLFISYAGYTFGVNLAWLGVAVFAGGAVFALATLPVELNASARARLLLSETGIISTAEEQRGVNTVLNAAALTYVAALVTAVLQLLYYVSLVSGLGRRRR